MQNLLMTAKTIPRAARDQYKSYADTQRYFVDRTLTPRDFEDKIQDLLVINPNRQVVEFYFRLARFNQRLATDYILDPSLVIFEKKTQEVYLSKRKRQQLKRQTSTEMSRADQAHRKGRASNPKPKYRSTSQVSRLEKELSSEEISLVRSLLNDDIHYAEALQTFIIMGHDLELTKSILSS